MSGPSMRGQRTQTWHELESDPGLFTLLLEDIGCKGAQVEEIYDLQQKIDSHVYGFIFLFNWLEDRRMSFNNRNYRNYDCTLSETTKSNRSKTITTTTSTMCHVNDDQHHQQEQQSSHDWSYVTDDNIVESMFFARQIISNSCATHALLSILMNCNQRKELELGDILKRLNENTLKLTPEQKGYAIGNLPELAKAHNSHASFISRYNRRSLASCSRVTGNQRTMLQQSNRHDTFHFVSFVPINNHLIELDGLQSYPIDHGLIGEDENWTEKFRQVIKGRLSQKSCNGYSNDIRYNLMALVPDRRVELSSRINCLRKNQKLVLQAIDELTRRFQSPLSIDTDVRPSSASPQPSSLGSSNTDTASEASSAFNSPTSAPSPYSRGSKASSYSLHSSDDRLVKFFVVKLGTPRAITPDSNTGPKSTMTTCGVDGDNRAIEDSISCEMDDNHPTSSQSNIVVNRIDSGSTNATQRDQHQPRDILEDVSAKNLKLSLSDLVKLSRRIEFDIENNEQCLREEHEKRRKYKIDDCRRIHNYEPFIVTFLYMLAQKGQLADLIEKDLGIVTTTTSIPTQTATPQAPPSPQTSATITTTVSKTKTRTKTVSTTTTTTKALTTTTTTTTRFTTAPSNKSNIATGLRGKVTASNIANSRKFVDTKQTPGRQSGQRDRQQQQEEQNKQRADRARTRRRTTTTTSTTRRNLKSSTPASSVTPHRRLCNTTSRSQKIRGSE